MASTDNYWTRARSSSFTRRRFLAGSATAAFGSAAILAGCGDDDTKKTATASASSAATGAATGAATAPAAGKRGGTFRVVKAVPDTGVDPAITNTYVTHTARTYSTTHLYQASTDKLLFDLATKIEQTDAQTLTITIRQDALFLPEVANGRRVVASDLAYSWNRYPDMLKSFGSQFNKTNWGWMDAAAGATFVTPDDNTIIIKQNKPFASNLIAMGNHQFAVVAKEMVEASGDKTLRKVDNAGSGPYKMVKHESTGTRFERNPNYKRSNPSEAFLAAGPYFDAWEERIIADPASAKAAFIAGELDILSTSLVPVDKIVAEELAKQSGVKVLKDDSKDHLILAFDAVKWIDPNLRKAISLAWDRTRFINTVYVGDGILGAPVSAGFKDFSWSQDKLKGYQKYDPTEARKLWDAGGGAAKFNGKLKITTNSGIPLFAQAAQVIGEDLKKNLGVDVQIDNVDGNSYVAKAVAPVKEWDLFVAYNLSLNTIPDYNALTLYVPTGFGGIFPNMKLESTVPEVAALAKQIQDLYEAQAAELDRKARTVKLDALQEFILTNNATCIPLPVQKTKYQPIRDYLRNYPEKDWVWGSASANEFRIQTVYSDKTA